MSNVARLFPREAHVSVGGEQRKAMVDQLTIVSVTRGTHRMGHIAPAGLAGVERARRA